MKVILGGVCTIPETVNTLHMLNEREQRCAALAASHSSLMLHFLPLCSIEFVFRPFGQINCTYTTCILSARTHVQCSSVD